ncbi:MAG: M17 family peptidase N-terminal domain-containing protein, partial [Thermoproteota archaeon]|nr:M17 family peptidase N-terminal domain-containing protein [Thermoproteota archaeon]
MRVRAESVIPGKKKTAVLCAFCFEDTDVPIGIEKFNKKIVDTVLQSVKEIKGKKNKISIIHSHKEIPPERILIAGLGKKNKITSDIIRDVTGNITKKVHELGIKEFTIIVPNKIPIKNDQVISAIVEGANLSLYDFDLFRKEKSNKNQPDLSLLFPDKSTSEEVNVHNIIKNSIIISDAVKFTRDVANLPPNECP